MRKVTFVLCSDTKENRYFCLIIFTTTGYGDYTTIGLEKMFATIEAYMGAFLMSLFVIAVYKNMMER